jgi:hypothetical protein
VYIRFAVIHFRRSFSFVVFVTDGGIAGVAAVSMWPRIRTVSFLCVCVSVFGPKIDEVTGDWRKLHNEELHRLYSSPSTGLL